MAKDLLIIGDSNVTRHYARLGYQVQNVTVVQARNLSEITEALKAINSSFKIIVFACLTNLLVASGEAGASSAERLAAVSDQLNVFIPMLRFVLQPLIATYASPKFIWIYFRFVVS